MQPGGSLSLCLLVLILILALVLDAGLILVWRRLRQRRASSKQTLSESLPGTDIALSHPRWRVPLFARRYGEGFGAALERLWVQAISWLEYCARLWKDEVWSDDRRAMKFIVAVACVFISASIGYAYAGEIWVQGWQLWMWAACVVVIAVCLIPAGRPPLRLDRGCVWPGILMLAAMLLRVTFLESVPGGLHVDEAAVAEFSLNHVFPEPRRTVNPFRTGAYSQPALHHYIVRLSLAAMGNSITGLRISSALAGTAAVLATYAAIAVWQGRWTALLGALVMTTYHFHIHWSRIGLNNIWDSLWVPWMVAAFAWGWKERWSGGAVLSGLALGFSQYFYAGSKLGILLLVFAIFWLWRQDRDRHRLVTHVGKLLLAATCVAAPIALFALRDPGPYFERTSMVIGWRRDAIREITGDPLNILAYGWHQVWRSVAAFTALPDSTGFYDSGVPLVIGLGAVCFVGGLLWAVRKRQPLPVAWIILTILLGGVMMTGVPSSARYVVSIPAICWLIVQPSTWLMNVGRRRLAVLLLLIIVATDLFSYFGLYVPGGPRDLIHPFPPWPPSPG